MTSTRAIRGAGVEEVHADQPAGPVECGSERGHGQRGRVGREQGVGVQHALDGAQHAALDAEILHHRLDDDPATGELLQRAHRMDPAPGGLGLGGTEPPGCRVAVQRRRSSTRPRSAAPSAAS
jgi:hypothetical protein